MPQTSRRYLTAQAGQRGWEASVRADGGPKPAPEREAVGVAPLRATRRSGRTVTGRINRRRGASEELKRALMPLLPITT
jgi:hypothetical protein